MIIRMPTFRTRQRYEPSPPGSRANAAASCPSPRLTESRARRRVGGAGTAQLVVVSLEVADHTEPERRPEILKLRRRVEKLGALLRLALALLHLRVRFSGLRLPDGDDKRRILRPVDRYCCEPASGSWVGRRAGFRLASTAARVCARRSVVRSSHVTAIDGLF